MNDLVKEKLAELRMWRVSARTAVVGIIGYIWTKDNDSSLMYNASYFVLVGVFFAIVSLKFLINRQYKEIK